MKITNYDRINVPRFNDGKEAGYLCSMCGQYATMSESVSYKGWNLVCNQCFWKFKAILGNRDILKAIQEVGQVKKKLMEGDLDEYD